MRTDHRKRKLVSAHWIPATIAYDRLGGDFPETWDIKRFFKYDGEWYDIQFFDEIDHTRFPQYSEWDGRMPISEYFTLFIKFCVDRNGERAVIVGREGFKPERRNFNVKDWTK